MQKNENPNNSYTDITKLSQESGFSVFNAKFKDTKVKSAYIANLQKKEIYVEESLPETEKRFYIALELAHYLKNKSHSSDTINITTQNLNKLETNKEVFNCALDMLIPEKNAKRIWNATLGNIRVFSFLFRVPEIIGTQRLISLKLINNN